VIVDIHHDPRIDTSRGWPITPVHAAELPRSMAWRGSGVTERDWLLTLPDACLAGQS
jgi:hypothetical protein